MRSIVLRGLGVFCVLAIAWGCYELVQMQRGFAKATELASFGLWENARTELAKFLRLHPSDPYANFLMADLFVQDDRLPGGESAPRALVHLDRIAPDAPIANRVRILKARLQFLVLHKPAAAEKLLREAISQDENSREAHQLLCTLYELTGRFHSIEPYFWRSYELTPPAERAGQMRYWYMSQFFPLTTNDELDRMMGFTDAATPSMPAEAVRCFRFREAEPNEPVSRVALARWMRRSGKPREALDVLGLKDSAVDEALRDPFFVVTLVDLLVDMGEYDQAEARFQQWPGPQDGFDYWRLKAILYEQSRGDYATALAAYDRALEIWPGPGDWRLMHRKAGCLAQSGKTEQAAEVRTHAQTVEKLMENSVHQRIRYVLGFLENPDYLREVADFYRKLGREREVAAWLREAGSRIADTLK